MYIPVTKCVMYTVAYSTMFAQAVCCYDGGHIEYDIDVPYGAVCCNCTVTIFGAMMVAA